MFVTPQMKTLKILQWNCRGLLGKVDLIKDIIYEYDVLLFNETWLMEEKKIYIPNYTIIRKDRAKKKGEARNTNVGGGVCIAIKSNIPFKKFENILNITDKIEAVAISISINNNLGTGNSNSHKNNLLLVSFYHPPTIELNKNDWLNFLQSTGNFEYKVIGGDANSHHQSWGPTKASSSGSNLFDIIDDLDLVLLNNGSYTYINPNPNKERFSCID